MSDFFSDPTLAPALRRHHFAMQRVQHLSSRIYARHTGQLGTFFMTYIHPEKNSTHNINGYFTTKNSKPDNTKSNETRVSV